MAAKIDAKIPYITKIVMGPNFVRSLDKMCVAVWCRNNIYSRKQICNKASSILDFVDMI